MKLVRIAALFFLFAPSHAVAQPTDLITKVEVARLLNGKMTSSDQANCVNAALLASGFRIPVMHISPTVAQESILPSCYIEDEQSRDFAALFDRAGKLIHAFTPLDDNKSATAMVFTKNGVDIGAKFQIMRFSDMFESYRGSTRTIRYFRRSPNSNCVLDQFVKHIQQDKTLQTAADATWVDVLDKTAKNFVDFDVLMKRWISIGKMNTPLRLLESDLLLSVLAQDKHRDSRRRQAEQEYITLLSSRIAEHPSLIVARQAEQTVLYSAYLRFLKNAGIDLDFSELNSRPAYHISIGEGRTLLRLGGASFYYMPANVHERDVVDIGINCAPGNAEYCEKNKRSAEDLLSEVWKRAAPFVDTQSGIVFDGHTPKIKFGDRIYTLRVSRQDWPTDVSVLGSYRDF